MFASRLVLTVVVCSVAIALIVDKQVYVTFEQTVHMWRAIFRL